MDPLTLVGLSVGALVYSGIIMMLQSMRNKKDQLQRQRDEMNFRYSNEFLRGLAIGRSTSLSRSESISDSVSPSESWSISPSESGSYSPSEPPDDGGLLPDVDDEPEVKEKVRVSWGKRAKCSYCGLWGQEQTNCEHCGGSIPKESRR